MFHKVKKHASNFKHTRINILHILLRINWYKQTTYLFTTFFMLHNTILLFPDLKQFNE